MPTTNPDVSSNRFSLNFWGVLAAIALAVVFYFVVIAPDKEDAAGEGRRHAAVKQRLSEINLVPLEGSDTPVTSATLTGKVVVLNFWAVWCPPCKVELPLLSDYAYSQRDNEELVILPIVYDEPETDTREWLAASVPNIYKLLGVSIPTYFDPQAVTQQAMVETVKDSVFPTTVVLDRSGTIRGVYLGYSPRDFLSMKRLVNDLLAEK